MSLHSQLERTWRQSSACASVLSVAKETAKHGRLNSGVLARSSQLIRPDASQRFTVEADIRTEFHRVRVTWGAFASPCTPLLRYPSLLERFAGNALSLLSFLILSILSFIFLPSRRQIRSIIHCKPCGVLALKSNLLKLSSRKISLTLTRRVAESSQLMPPISQLGPYISSELPAKHSTIAISTRLHTGTGQLTPSTTPVSMHTRYAEVEKGETDDSVDMGLREFIAGQPLIHLTNYISVFVTQLE